MKLYHGSNQVIKKPDLLKGRKFLDFGSGFYLSDEEKQAENRAKSAVLFFEEGVPTVNVFEWGKEIFTYLNISLITMLIGIIVEKNGLSEQDAIMAFYNSKTAQKLNNKNILLRQMSPYLLYELWNAEVQTGNYKSSPYTAALL